MKSKLQFSTFQRDFILNFIFYCCWFKSNCSSSSADRKRNAAASRYPVINCLTATASVTFKLWGRRGRLTDKSVGPASSINKTSRAANLSLNYLARLMIPTLDY